MHQFGYDGKARNGASRQTFKLHVVEGVVRCTIGSKKSKFANLIKSALKLKKWPPGECRYVAMARQRRQKTSSLQKCGRELKKPGREKKNLVEKKKTWSRKKKAGREKKKPGREKKTWSSLQKPGREKKKIFSTTFYSRPHFFILDHIFFILDRVFFLF